MEIGNMIDDGWNQNEVEMEELVDFYIDGFVRGAELKELVTTQLRVYPNFKETSSITLAIDHSGAGNLRLSKTWTRNWDENTRFE